MATNKPKSRIRYHKFDPITALELIQALRTKASQRTIHGRTYYLTHSETEEGVAYFNTRQGAQGFISVESLLLDMAPGNKPLSVVVPMYANPKHVQSKKEREFAEALANAERLMYNIQRDIAQLHSIIRNLQKEAEQRQASTPSLRKSTTHPNNSLVSQK